MKDPTVRGVVHLIEETKSFGQKGFRKRLLVLEQSKGSFTNFVPVEFVKDGCDAVDDLTVGDEIEVTYRLSGRRWQRDEASEVKFFLSAEGLSFKRISGGGRAHGQLASTTADESKPGWMNQPLLSIGRRTDGTRCVFRCGLNQQIENCRGGSAFVPCLMDEQSNLIVIQ